MKSSKTCKSNDLQSFFIVVVVADAAAAAAGGSWGAVGNFSLISLCIQ